jgi:hypothetical protein
MTDIKRTIYRFFTASILILTTSCGGFDINGHLDGMWHLRTVESLSNNTVTDVKEQCIYYSVLQDLITVRRLGVDEHGKSYLQKIGRFVHTNDSLILHNFVVFQNEGISATPEELNVFYLDGLTSRYGIKCLEKDKMILRSNQRELTFKKF